MISRSGVLGYQPGSGLLLLGGVAFTAQTGGTFSLLLEGDANRRGSGFPARLPASAPGEGTLLIKKPPPERSVRAVLLSSLCSGILEICRWQAAEEMRIGQNSKKRIKRARNGGKLKRGYPLRTHLSSLLPWIFPVRFVSRDPSRPAPGNPQAQNVQEIVRRPRNGWGKSSKDQEMDAGKAMKTTDNPKISRALPVPTPASIPRR